MRVAVLTLTRDRLEYTQHCFARLHEHAGCDFDHYVFDQGSTDGTASWLAEEEALGYFHEVNLSPHNLGIHKAMNYWLDRIDGRYDVVVKVDNDCELIRPGTLRAVAECHIADPDAMIGPLVRGLRSPMPRGLVRDIVGHRVAETPMIGGIMQPVPAGYRYDESQPTWGMDDNRLCDQASWCGQLVDFPVNHYETTDGQWKRYPGYFATKISEGLPG